MPVSHRFSRRAAAIGAALALAALPISATVTPAFAQPSPTPTAEASSNAEAGASAGADSDSGDDAGSTADSTDGADADSSSADDGSAEAEGGDGGPNPAEEGDKACADPKWTSDDPCAINGELTAEWQMLEKQLAVPPNDQDDPEGTLPKSWVGKPFKAPKQAMKRIPAQSSADHATGSVENGSGTDDSGQSVAEATAQASIPDTVQFNEDGVIVDADGSGPVKFENFDALEGPDPAWTFALNDDGQIAVANGQPYPDDDAGDDAESSSGSDGSTSNDSETGADGGSKDTDPAPTADGSTSSDGSDSDSSESADTDGVTADDGSASDAGTDGSSSDSDTSDDSTSSTDSTTSSDSDSTERADTSADGDSEGRESDSDTDSGSDGSRSSDSDSSDSGEDDEKDSDGAGSSAGTSDADGTTPDPATGNGSPDDERETIPGNAGDEFLPGDDEGAERPDYSDPVPRNPDEQTSKDDTDLITGGDQPSPRANQNPATSFGESIISTIVSSWPIFVLAASGMAAVGFIIYLMGRRGKQD